MQELGVEVRLTNSLQSVVFSHGAKLETFSCTRSREDGKVVTTVQIVIIEAAEVAQKPTPSRRTTRSNQRSDAYFALRKARSGRLFLADQSPQVKMTEKKGSASNYSPKTVTRGSTVQSASREPETRASGAEQANTTSISSSSGRNAEFAHSSDDEAVAGPSKVQEAKEELSSKQMNGMDVLSVPSGLELAVDANQPKDNANPHVSGLIVTDSYASTTPSVVTSSPNIAVSSVNVSTQARSLFRPDGLQRAKVGAAKQESFQRTSSEWTQVGLRGRPSVDNALLRDRYQLEPKRLRERWAFEGGSDSLAHVWCQDGYFFKHDASCADFVTGFFPLVRAPEIIQRRVKRWADQVQRLGCRKHQLCSSHATRWNTLYSK